MEGMMDDALHTLFHKKKVHMPFRHSQYARHTKKSIYNPTGWQGRKINRRADPRKPIWRAG